MTRQYIDDYLSDNQIQVKESIDISSMDLLIDFALSVSVLPASSKVL